MTILVKNWIGATLLGFSLALMIGPGTTYAQGSTGGSIGNDDKAVSGSRIVEPRAVEKPARRSRTDADEPRRPSPRKSSGGGGSGTFVQSDGCRGRWTASKQ